MPRHRPWFRAPITRSLLGLSGSSTPVAALRRPAGALVRRAALAGAVVIGAAGRVCAQTPDSSAGPAPAAARSVEGPAASPAWLVADLASRTVALTLTVTRGADGSALINGHRRGQLQIVVPLTWTVRWDWHNADSTAAHSLVVMVEREKLPTEGGRAAFTNAMSRAVSAGLKVGETDKTTFTAEEAGWYWLLCGVPGHAIAGEYLGLRVDPEARTAAVKAK